MHLQEFLLFIGKTLGQGKIGTDLWIINSCIQSAIPRGETLLRNTCPRYLTQHDKKAAYNIRAFNQDRQLGHVVMDWAEHLAFDNDMVSC